MPNYDCLVFLEPAVFEPPPFCFTFWAYKQSQSSFLTIVIPLSNRGW